MNTRRNILAMGAVLSAALIARAKRALAVPGDHGNACDHNGEGVPPFCACFARGTRIRMADGSQARVEDILPGDEVATADGPQKVEDVTSYEAIIAPVHFRPGSMGVNAPSADLYVTPAHAVLFKGVLLCAGLLVNGRTITLGETTVGQFFHVKTAIHSTLWAEGLAAETLLAPDVAPGRVSVLGFNGGRSQIMSRLRSLFSTRWLDFRTPLDVIRDDLEAAS